MKLKHARQVPPLPTSRHALLLNFDGTLIERAEHPVQAAVPEVLHGLLAGLERRLEGALAIVTGRRLESLDAALSPLRLRAAGVCGAQLRAAPDEAAVEARALVGIVERLQERFAGNDAIRIEDKGAAIAVHYREGAMNPAAIEASMVSAIAQQRLDIVAGKGVFEIRSHGHRKDLAVRELMSRPPFRHRIPVFVGDDASDEDGIREAQTWGGIGVKVGAGHSAAQWRLADPAAVVAWLRETLWSLPDV
ncbi:MAG: trehalose-phosphatase [Nevskia sp.]